MRILYAAGVIAVAFLLVSCGDGAAPAGSAAAVADALPAETGPSAAELDFAEITSGWSDAALEGCGRVLEEALGTRDLVQGALDGVRDEHDVAAAELEDARYWLQMGQAKIAEVRGRLETGECDGQITLALDEAVQFFVKSGTSAVQASQMAGS